MPLHPALSEHPPVRRDIRIRILLHAGRTNGTISCFAMTPTNTWLARADISSGVIPCGE
ncbi:MAG: hypothetical protein HYX27_11910 [Acidobacteria bacterium]|nr:hypothetical protein [Acidobacteriota bacterium]